MLGTQAAAALDHSNICTVYEIDEADGQTSLSVAYLEGETVKEKIKNRPLKLEDVLDIAIQTAQGLQAAHEKKIAHRDIKSANLMVTKPGRVKVMDFGNGTRPALWNSSGPSPNCRVSCWIDGGYEELGLFGNFPWSAGSLLRIARVRIAPECSGCAIILYPANPRRRRNYRH